MTEADRNQLQQEAAARGIALTAEQLSAFVRLAAELTVWNRRINLTAITQPAEIVTKHFLDSLTLVPLLKADDFMLDVGSGAGFPALPVKIVLPGLALVTVDAVQKKIHFQRHIIRTLGLTGMTALHSRVEALVATHGGAFTVVTSRAFTALADFAALALPLLAPSGRILAMKGREGEAEAVAAAGELARLGLTVTAVMKCTLPQGAGERSIVVMQRSDGYAEFHPW